LVRLKKKESVKYKSFGKDEAFHIEMDIDGKRLDVVAWHYPAEKQVETKGDFGASPYSVRAKGERRREEKGDWDAVIVTPDYGYLPVETWKRLRNSVSATISVATGSRVLPSSINLSGSMPISQKLPKEGDYELIYCPNPRCETKRIHHYRAKLRKWECAVCGSLNA